MDSALGKGVLLKMKKIKQSLAVKKTAAMLLMLSLMLVMFTGCGKKAVTTADFKALATEKGLSCTDALDQFAPYAFVKEVTIAAPSDLSYQIEFYVLSDESYAQSFFETSKINFDMNKSEVYTDSSKSGKGYARYSLNSGGRYMFVEYIGNTMLYVNTEDSNQSTVDAFIKELKY